LQKPWYMHADRFWYERDLKAQDLHLVQDLSLGDIIKLNTNLTNVQDNVFIFDVRTDGVVWNDKNGNGRRDSREAALSNAFVYMVDGDGAVVDFTYTDSQGRYEMSQVQVGDYSVFAQGPDGWVQTTAEIGNLHVNTDIQFHKLNFGFRNPAAQVPALSSGGASAVSTLTSQLDASKLVDGNVFSDTLMTTAV